MKLLFFDTETTGLPKNYKAPYTDVDNFPRLVQIAWILYNVGEGEAREVSTNNCIVTPDGFDIPEEASAVHGFSTEEALKWGIPLKHVVNKFHSDVRIADVVLAHNISFDRNIYASELVRAGKAALAQEFMSSPMKCTMEASTDYCKLAGNYGYKWPKLAELHSILFNEEFEGAHDALVDIRATAKCYFKLVELGIM
jgi:DNA polymerase-3 subunit epsilon